MEKGVIKVITPPGAEPLTLAAAKNHLRIDTSGIDEDTYIASLITVAREYCEWFQRKAYINTTMSLILNEIPTSGSKIILPRGPVSSITSIKINQRGTTAVTILSSQYDVNLASREIVFNSDYNPEYDSSLVPVTGGLEITFVAGYGAADTNVPASPKHAMLLLIGHFYENREATTDKFEVLKVPMAVEMLLQQGRIY